MCNILDTFHNNIIHLREPKTEIFPPSTHPYFLDDSQTAISFTHSDIKYFLKTFPNNPLICTDNPPPCPFCAKQKHVFDI